MLVEHHPDFILDEIKTAPAPDNHHRCIEQTRRCKRLNHQHYSVFTLNKLYRIPKAKKLPDFSAAFALFVYYFTVKAVVAVTVSYPVLLTVAGNE